VHQDLSHVWHDSSHVWHNSSRAGIHWPLRAVPSMCAMTHYMCAVTWCMRAKTLHMCAMTHQEQLYEVAKAHGTFHVRHDSLHVCLDSSFHLIPESEVCLQRSSQVIATSLQQPAIHFCVCVRLMMPTEPLRAWEFFFPPQDFSRKTCLCNDLQKFWLERNAGKRCSIYT